MHPQIHMGAASWGDIKTARYGRGRHLQVEEEDTVKL